MMSSFKNFCGDKENFGYDDDNKRIRERFDHRKSEKQHSKTERSQRGFWPIYETYSDTDSLLRR